MLLSPQSVRQMTTKHLTLSQRQPGELFLESQGWGFGGSLLARDIGTTPTDYRRTYRGHSASR